MAVVSGADCWMAEAYLAKQATASTGRDLVDVPATGGLPTRDTLLGRAEA
jgi:hypothetical protein